MSSLPLPDANHQKSLAWARASLIGLNFFAETNRMEPLIAIYLIEAKDWDVVWVGYVSIVMNIMMIVFQTPAGDLMDKTRHKKLIVAAAFIVAAVTTAAIAWTSKLYAVLLIKAAEGIAASIFLPGLMSLLLAIVPEKEVPKTVSLTEVSNKLGSVLFSIGAGFIAYYAYPDVSYIFYLLGAGGLIAAAFVLAIPGGAIDNTRARAGADQKETDGAEPLPDKEGLKVSTVPEVQEAIEEAWGYKEILSDRKIIMFALLTFVYHLCNAAVVLLVAQLVAHDEQRAGLVFTSVVVCIFYFVQAPTAYIVGLTQERFGFKTLLMVSHLILPIRCAICGLLAIYYPNKYALAATQIFDGLGAGIYDTVMPLVVKSLVQGSGRFGVTFGFIVTCWRLGHGFSLLAGEAILKAAGGRYEVPFFVLGTGAILSCVLLAVGVSVPPPTRRQSEIRRENLARGKSSLEMSTTCLVRMSSRRASFLMDNDDLTLDCL